MSGVNEKYLKFTHAVDRLQEGIAEYNGNRSETVRDGVIHRFKLCSELAWKSAREYLFDVATSGETDADALNSARELLGCVIFGMEQDNEDLPAATPLSELKLEENESSALIDVFMPSVRMAQNNRSVNRTVTLPAWLNAKAQESSLNFSQLLQDAIKEKLQINS